MTDRISELEARIAADTAELERLKAEPDYERYRHWANAFTRDYWGLPMSRYDRLITSLLAARNHDPDVVALVEWARREAGGIEIRTQEENQVLAPFAAIKGD